MKTLERRMRWTSGEFTRGFSSSAEFSGSSVRGMPRLKLISSDGKAREMSNRRKPEHGDSCSANILQAAHQLANEILSELAPVKLMRDNDMPSIT